MLVTVAGTLLAPGFTGDRGPATLAKLSSPSDVAFDDTSSSIFIAVSAAEILRRSSVD